MTEQMPGPAPDEPAGDMADQASRLQMAQEQEAISAALAGRVEGTDALEDRGAVVEHLEGPELLEAAEADASDDPVHGGGTLVEPAGTSALVADDAVVDPELAMTGPAEHGAAMAVEEGSSTGADADRWSQGVEQDGDPDILDELLPADDAPTGEDVESLLAVGQPTHDPDDPRDPDGYGVPPAP